MAKVEALLRDSSGFERLYSDEIEDQYADNVRFMWEDGNMACDCNRHDEFQRAAGITTPEDAPCGDERYTALRAIFPDGTVIELDAPPKP